MLHNVMIPRNGFVVCKLIERTSFNVGAIIVPIGGEAFTEAEVVAVPAVSTHTEDLKVGQVVWVQHKRPQRNGQGQPVLADAFIPYRTGNDSFAVFEESQIMGIIANNRADFDAVQRVNREARTQEKLLSIN